MVLINTHNNFTSSHLSLIAFRVNTALYSNNNLNTYCYLRIYLMVKNTHSFWSFFWDQGFRRMTDTINIPSRSSLLITLRRNYKKYVHLLIEHENNALNGYMWARSESKQKVAFYKASLIELRNISEESGHLLGTISLLIIDRKSWRKMKCSSLQLIHLKVNLGPTSNGWNQIWHYSTKSTCAIKLSCPYWNEKMAFSPVWNTFHQVCFSSQILFAF